jgi:hypothetical protein
MKPIDIKRKPYQAPRLKQHASYTMLTGLSVPFNSLFEDPIIETGGKNK